MRTVNQSRITVSTVTCSNVHLFCRFRLRSTAHLIYWSVLEISVMAFMFERLTVYQKAIDFADEVSWLITQP
jgi:hypothetical protein